MSSSTTNNGTLIINGGVFIAQDGVSPITNYFTNAAPSVSGGNFSGPVDSDLLASYLKVELYSTAVNGAAPYSYYSSIGDAIAAADDAGDTDGIINILTGENTETITITLDANGGTCSVVSITAVKDSNVTLPTPSRSGYTFNGWSDGNGTTYKEGESITVTENMVLTAQWSRNTEEADDIQWQVPDTSVKDAQTSNDHNITPWFALMLAVGGIVAYRRKYSHKK